MHCRTAADRMPQESTSVSIASRAPAQAAATSPATVNAWALVGAAGACAPAAATATMNDSAAALMMWGRRRLRRDVIGLSFRSIGPDDAERPGRTSPVLVP